MLFCNSEIMLRCELKCNDLKTPPNKDLEVNYGEQVAQPGSCNGVSCNGVSCNGVSERKELRSNRIDPIKINCEDLWYKSISLVNLCNFAIGIHQKDKPLVVPIEILRDIVKGYCLTNHVEIKVEEPEVGCCPRKITHMWQKKVISIFIERHGEMKNLKYDLSDEYNRMSQLNISFKYVWDLAKPHE